MASTTESSVSFDQTDTRHDEMNSTIEQWIDELVAGVDDAQAEHGFEPTDAYMFSSLGIKELRDARLVDVLRFEEGRGGTTKYYGANTTVLSYSLPESSEPAIEDMIDAVQPQVPAVLATLTDEYDDVIDEITVEMQSCEHCRKQKYETYVLLTVLRRTFVRAYQDGETT